MSKIIISTGTLAQGGASRVCSNLLSHLCNLFDEVIFITWVDRPQFYDCDKCARWYCVEKEVGKNDIKRMLWFRKFIKREKPNLILSFLEPFNIRVLICTIGLGIKTIVSERNDPREVNICWIVGLLEKLVYRKADKIIVQTPTIKLFFNGVLDDRTHIIYNPVNIPDEMVAQALRTPKQKKVVSVARLVPQKKLDVLIKAFAIFHKTHQDYSLIIYGNGPLAGKLNRLSALLGVQKYVTIPGASKTIHKDILDAEMMCLVSAREGMSNAMIEAMTLGLPCICTKVSGAVDFISEDYNGYLVDIGDINGLAEKMKYIADHQSDAKRIAENATKIYELLNKEKIFGEWTDLLKSYKNAENGK